MKVNDLTTPALIVNVDKVKRNADRMLQRCKEYGVNLRPHFKTSKAIQAAVLQTGGTKRRMAVSTLAEAEFLMKNGFDDILYAYPFPISLSTISRCNALNDKLAEFHVLVDQRRQAEEIINVSSKSTKCWSVFISIDCGYHREGVLPDSEALIEMAKLLCDSDHIQFQGLYSHNGHSYYADDKLEINKITSHAVSRLLIAIERLKSIGIECKTYGLGSTPVCSQPSEPMRSVTEWHPGCYIFYDLQQSMIGGCQLDDIAAVVVTRVLGHYNYDGCRHLLVDCGWTALTLQGGGKVPSGGYGGIVDHPELKLESMTQEVGKIIRADGQPLNFDDYPVGSTLRVYPYHACATCSMHPVYHVVNSEDEIVDEWTPTRGW